MPNLMRFNESSGPTEGVHTKMKMMSRRPFGFKNFENYRMRVMAKGNRPVTVREIMRADIVLASHMVDWA